MEVGDTIYYLRDNKLHSAPIQSKVVVENLHEDWACTEEQKNIFTHYGPAGTRYYTCHGEVHADEAYTSPKELFKGLIAGNES